LCDAGTFCGKARARLKADAAQRGCRCREPGGRRERSAAARAVLLYYYVDIKKMHAREGADGRRSRARA
jgi:hypothetical protein